MMYNACMDSIKQDFKLRPKYLNNTNQFLPEGMAFFLKNRLLESIGFLLIIISLILFLSVYSYSANDSSLNTAGREVPANILGHFGAIASDLMLQTIGFACSIYILHLGMPIFLQKTSSKAIIKNGRINDL